MNAEGSRFVDDGTQMLDFLRRYTVVCPACGDAARVIAKEDEPFILFAPRRLTCAACGFMKEWAERSLTYPSFEKAVDWYFRCRSIFRGLAQVIGFGWRMQNILLSCAAMSPRSIGLANAARTDGRIRV